MRPAENSLSYRMKLVLTRSSRPVGGVMPAAFPASMHRIIQAILRPIVRMVCQALQILKHLLRLVAMYHIPVLGSNGHHIADAKIFVQHIKGCRSSAASCGKYGSSRFVRKRAACGIEQPVRKESTRPLGCA